MSFVIFLLAPSLLHAELRRIEVRRQDDFGKYERIIGRAFFSVDPALPANRSIADIALAPKNAQGQVEFSGDLLYFRPKTSRGTVFLEIVNRGRDQALALMSGANQRSLAPENWNLGDGFLIEQGFSVAYLGWEFDVPPSDGLTFQTPVAPVEGIVRETHIEDRETAQDIIFPLLYCAADIKDEDAKLTRRSRIDQPSTVLPRELWNFEDRGCSIQLRGAAPGIYDAIYRANNSPVAGLGLAAIRDFASYLKYGPKTGPLREDPAALQRVIGFGYSQSARFLRQFVRDGFNADEKGHAVFDGLMISSAGAGAGSFNHRFAMPDEAGNSVLSILRPVDVPPFDDRGLLANAIKGHAVPKIFYTLSSTEYWARAASLTHTDEAGIKDVSSSPTSRVYFITGTPHAAGPNARVPGYQNRMNFAQQRWSLRALLLDLDDWVRSVAEPPASRYPAIAKSELVPRASVRFPKIPGLTLPGYMPSLWKMDFGADFERTRVITNEPPILGEKLPVLVPQVDADGNDVSGIRIPEVAVPLGTYTGWNVRLPQLKDLEYLAGLVDSFEPFAKTREERERVGDPRLSIAERYSGKQAYLDRVEKVARDLVSQRFLLAGDVDAVVRRASAMWEAITQ